MKWAARPCKRSGHRGPAAAHGQPPVCQGMGMSIMLSTKCCVMGPRAWTASSRQESDLCWAQRTPPPACFYHPIHHYFI